MPGLTAAPSLDATLAHATLAALREPHLYGHRCDDGAWYNTNAGTRTPCRTLTRLVTLADQIDRLRATVHDAAHHDHTVTIVAAALYTGLEDATTDPERDPADEWCALDEESQHGFRIMARWGIEALSAVLDPDTRPELDLTRQETP